MFNLFFRSYEATFRLYSGDTKMNGTLGFTFHVPRFFGSFEKCFMEQYEKINTKPANEKCYILEKIERYYV